MNTNEYHPCPIDTTSVALSDDLVQLTELLAKNVHDTWAVNKIKEGWKFGHLLDPEKKTTPSLVPYEELSESQKEYDKATAMQTLKTIIQLGYSITMQEGESL